MTQTVTAPDGTVHTFPDEATPEMIAGALGVRHEAAPAAPQKQTGFGDTVVGDVAMSVPSGLVRGAAETAMLPVSIPRLISRHVLEPTVGKIADFLVTGVEDAGRAALGKSLTDEEKVARQARIDALRAQPNVLEQGQDAIRSGMDSVLHKPTTTPGKFAGTISEFAAPGGVIGKASSTATKVATKLAPKIGQTAANVTGRIVAPSVGDVVAPAVVSESAGQLTEGTALEPWARLLGAIMGTGAAGLSRTRASAPAVATRDAVTPGSVSPEQWKAAEDLAARAQAAGVPLTAPEAIQHATGGATQLGSLMRVVEGSQQGGAKLAPFFSERPKQVDQATETILNAIAPHQPVSPSALGSRTQEAAQGVIKDKNAAINAETKPLYQAAEPMALPEDAFNALAADPVFAAELKALRADPYSGIAADVPDNSIAVLDALKKRMDDVSGAATASGMRNKARVAEGAGGTVKAAAADASPEYAKALEIQTQRRANELEPLEAGPVGKVAATSDTRAAAEAVLPKKPLSGSEGEVASTVKALGAKDPVGTREIVRQSVSDAKDKSVSKLVSGDNQYAGARFAKEVAGSPQQEKNLLAALNALPESEAAAIVPNIVDILRATGQRVPIGSRTAFNHVIQDELSQGSAAVQAGTVAKSAGTALPGILMDRAKRMVYGKNISALGDMFVDPKGVQRIRDIIEAGGTNPMRDAGVSIMFTAPQQMRQK